MIAIYLIRTPFIAFVTLQDDEQSVAINSVIWQWLTSITTSGTP